MILVENPLVRRTPDRGLGSKGARGKKGSSEEKDKVRSLVKKVNRESLGGYGHSRLWQGVKKIFFVAVKEGEGKSLNLEDIK